MMQRVRVVSLSLTCSGTAQAAWHAGSIKRCLGRLRTTVAQSVLNHSDRMLPSDPSEQPP